jgi:hypothetical protein
MAVKVKKTTAKKTTTKKAPKKVIKEVADSIIENSESVSATETEELEKIEVRQEILDKIKFDEAVLENLKKEDEMKKQDPPIEKVEVVNGDPAVIAPKEEVKVTEIHEEAIKQTFKHINNRKGAIDRSFGYSWNGMEMD